MRDDQRMSRRLTAMVLVTLLAGCVAGGPMPSSPLAQPPAPAPAPPSGATPVPQSAASAPSVSPSAVAPPSPSRPATPDGAGPAKDTRTGAELDRPYVVDGIPVVSKAHPISREYQPADPAPDGLEREAADALATMTAAAKRDGVTIRVHSGYRSYDEQATLLKEKIAEYGDEARARRYNAEPGKSEHQTGLAVDLWDGATWGLAVRNTKTGKWLWRHAREYGFILRYPPDKEKITGYAYEPWHFRHIGERSLDFKPNTSLTLEEYLGLA